MLVYAWLGWVIGYVLSYRVRSDLDALRAEGGCTGAGTPGFSPAPYKKANRCASCAVCVCVCHWCAEGIYSGADACLLSRSLYKSKQVCELCCVCVCVCD